MGKTNSATDSDDEAGVNYGNSFAFSIIHINIIHSYAATTNNFNPGQASIMSLRTLVALRTRTTSTFFVYKVSDLLLCYFSGNHFKSTFSKARIPLLKFRHLLILSFYLYLFGYLINRLIDKK
jgi:hypothetical protein